MAFVSTKKLKELQKQFDIISPFREGRVKNGAYELSLGDQVFLTDGKPRTVKSLSSGEKIYIEPGQFALLLTEEKVNIPKTKIAFISIKATIKYKGLINVSGFHVDPGFNGKLLFSVYNVGPTTIVLSRGSAYFPIWFADLNEAQDYEGNHNNQSNIPDSAVEPLSQGEINSPNTLSKRITDLNHQITNLRTTLGILITITIALTAGIIIKVLLDSNKLKEAVDYGYQKKTEEITTDSTYKKMQGDINLLTKEVDSLRTVINKPTVNTLPQKQKQHKAH